MVISLGFIVFFFRKLFSRFLNRDFNRLFFSVRVKGKGFSLGIVFDIVFGLF